MVAPLKRPSVPLDPALNVSQHRFIVQRASRGIPLLEYHRTVLPVAPCILVATPGMIREGWPLPDLLYQYPFQPPKSKGD